MSAELPRKVGSEEIISVILLVSVILHSRRFGESEILRGSECQYADMH